MKYMFNQMKPLENWHAILLGAGGLMLLGFFPFMKSIVFSRIQNSQFSTTNTLNGPTMSVLIDRPIGQPHKNKNLFITAENYPCMFAATHSINGNANGGECSIDLGNGTPSVAVARNSENLDDFSVNVSRTVKPVKIKKAPASTTSKIGLLKNKINSFIWLENQSPPNKKWLIGVGGEFVVTDKIVTSNSVVLSKNTVKNLAARAHDFGEQKELLNGLARVKTSVNFGNGLKKGFEEMINSQLGSLLSTSGIQEIKLPEIHTLSQAHSPNFLGFSAIKTNQESFLLNEDEFTILCHMGDMGELADTYLETARALQRIITIPSTEVVDFTEIEKFRKFISVLEKQLINEGFSNDAVVTVSKPGSPPKLGFEWKPDYCLKIYSPETNLFGLKVAGSFKPSSQEVSIGLGAAEVAFGSGNVGLLIGVDTGVRFHLNNSSLAHFSYRGLVLNGFVGVGFSTSL